MGARLRRREDWPRVLHDEVQAARKRQFNWVDNYCVLWAADVVRAMTGTDLMADYRGVINSRTSAYAILRRDFGTLEAALTARLGDPLPRPLFAQRGDVALVRVIDDTGEETEAVGICVGADVAVVAPAGLLFVPITDVLKAWRV